MLHNLKSPCAECPFRKTAVPGWLGPDKPAEVIAQVHSEGGYGCHMALEGRKDANREGRHPRETVEHCAGAMIHANVTHKRYRAPEMAAHQDRLAKCKVPVMGWEFLPYHGAKAEGR